MRRCSETPHWKVSVSAHSNSLQISLHLSSTSNFSDAFSAFQTSRRRRRRRRHLSSHLSRALYIYSLFSLRFLHTLFFLSSLSVHSRLLSLSAPWDLTRFFFPRLELIFNLCSRISLEATAKFLLKTQRRIHLVYTRQSPIFRALDRVRHALSLSLLYIFRDVYIYSHCVIFQHIPRSGFAQTLKL